MLKVISLLFFLLINLNLAAQQETFNFISWNIRDFGRTKSSTEIEQIAAILRKADLVAIQEVVAGYGGAQAVARLADELNRMGSSWDYAISNPTQSPKYVTERYAYLWKNTNIKIKNRGRLVKYLNEAVDREPFLLQFYIYDARLSVLNFHARPYNKNPQEEIQAVNRFVTDSLSGAVLLAGDFNVVHQDSIFKPLIEAGYQGVLDDQKTTLKRLCTDEDYLNHAIDNIFYSRSIEYQAGEAIDFIGACERLEAGRYLSDHLPVSLSFKLKEE